MSHGCGACRTAALPSRTALTFSPTYTPPASCADDHNSRSRRATPACTAVGVMHRNVPLDVGRAGTSESPNHLSGVLLYAAFTHDRPNRHCASGMSPPGSADGMCRPPTRSTGKRFAPRTVKLDLP